MLIPLFSFGRQTEKGDARIEPCFFYSFVFFCRVAVWLRGLGPSSRPTAGVPPTRRCPRTVFSGSFCEKHFKCILTFVHFLPFYNHLHFNMFFFVFLSNPSEFRVFPFKCPPFPLTSAEPTFADLVVSFSSLPESPAANVFGATAPCQSNYRFPPHPFAFTPPPPIETKATHGPT